MGMKTRQAAGGHEGQMMKIMYIYKEHPGSH